MTPPRLTPAARLPADVDRPRYDRAALASGILHLGLGAFHRAHQAVITEAALNERFGPWGIEAVSLRSAATVDALHAQDGLYTVLTRHGDRTDAQLVGAIKAAHAARRTPQHVLERLCDPQIRIVTLTVTEKAYGLDGRTGGLDRSHADVGADLETPQAPRGVLGHLVEALARRHAAGITPFTVLSCDNLAGNGAVLRRLVTAFAEARNPSLARWVEAEVAFPSSMVDRIVPAPTDRTLSDAARLTGCSDLAAVETEPFVQWVIEDRFTAGRPAWEAGGALFVADVAPFERMKLRLLNGAHSLIAYLGQNRGIALVREVVAVPALRRLVTAHMREAARTIGAVPGIDLATYCDSLLRRFDNTAIAHATRQIAADGTQKIPQRLLQPALEAVAAGRTGAEYARAVAEWIVYCCRNTDIDDPRAGDLLAAAAQARDGNPPRIQPFLALDGLFPPRLRADPQWSAAVQAAVDACWRETGPR